MLFLPFVIPCGSQRLCNEGAVTEGWGGTFLHTKGGGQTSCERGRGLSPLPVPPVQVSQRGFGGLSRNLRPGTALSKTFLSHFSLSSVRRRWQLPREVLQGTAANPAASQSPEGTLAALGDTCSTRDVGTLQDGTPNAAPQCGKEESRSGQVRVAAQVPAGSPQCGAVQPRLLPSCHFS